LYSGPARETRPGRKVRPAKKNAPAPGLVFIPAQLGTEGLVITTPADKIKVAILATDGVERVELSVPQKAFKDAGFHVDVISPAGETLQAWDHDEKSEAIAVDRPLAGADPAFYDALVLPGGVRNPDALRLNPEAVRFVGAMVESGKPVAAICHGPWLLIEADVVRGMRVTSWPSLRTDLSNAGAVWVDSVVVHDDWLVTSRKPDDLSQFCETAISLFRIMTAALVS
jgi:protease I